MEKTRYNRGSREFNRATNLLLEIEDNLYKLQRRGFDETFVNSVVDFMSNKDHITKKQYDAVVNISNKWLEM
jgi:DNA-directed RNA polymerase subunit L